MTAARFTLDEAKAAEWLSAQVAQYERWLAGEAAESSTLELGESYAPRDDYDGVDTFNLMYEAREAGLIAGPGFIEYDHRADGDGTGYVWLVYLDGTGSPTLSAGYEKIGHLGDGRDVTGAAGALGVLREAVATANRLLDNLDAYAAAHCDALDRIASLLSGQEWSADTCDDIAAIVRGTGREVRDWLTGREAGQ